MAEMKCPHAASKEEAERQIYQIAEQVAQRLEDMGRIRRGGVCVSLDLRCHPNNGKADYYIWIEDAKDRHLHRVGWAPPPEDTATSTSASPQPEGLR